MQKTIPPVFADKLKLILPELRSHGFVDGAALYERTGEPITLGHVPPPLAKVVERQVVQAPPEGKRYAAQGVIPNESALDDLIRLFLTGGRVPRERLERTLSNNTLATLLQQEHFIRCDGADLIAEFQLIPWMGMYFVADRNDIVSQGLAEVVLPPDMSTTVLLESLISVQRPFKRVVDIGSGCGPISLALKKWGAAEVIALDINPRAQLLTEFNSRLNELEVMSRTCEANEPFSGIDPGSVDFATGNAPCLYEVSSLSSVACSISDGDSFIRAFYSALPQVLSENGLAVFRHDIVSTPENRFENQLVDLGLDQGLNVVWNGIGRHTHFIPAMESGRCFVHRSSDTSHPFFQKVPAWQSQTWHDIERYLASARLDQESPSIDALRPKLYDYIHATLDVNLGSGHSATADIIRLSDSLGTRAVCCKDSMLPILKRCDGTLPVTQILKEAGGDTGQALEELARLHRLGVLYFAP